MSTRRHLLVGASKLKSLFHHRRFTAGSGWVNGAADQHPRSVYEVPTDIRSLLDFVQKLQPGHPRTNTIQMSVRNVIEGKLSARFYTNGWPLFTAAVCQVLFPRLSEVADLVCHSTSKEELLHLLRGADLVSWGKWQVIHGVEAAHTDYLTEELRPADGENKPGLKCSVQGSYYYYPGEMSALENKRSDLEGYFMAELEPRHLDLVLSYWPFLPNGWPLEHRRTFFDFVIRHCSHAAVFQTDSPVTPVGWMMQFPHGAMGNGYIFENHRRKGIAKALGIELMQKVLAKHYMPEWLVAANNPARDDLSQKVGAVEMYMYQRLLVIP